MSPTMAISNRRAALLCRKVAVILRTSRYFSHVASYFRNPAASSYAVPNSPAIDFLLEFRRGFAKRRRQWDEDDIGCGGGDGNRVEAVNMGPKIKEAAVSKMEAAVDALSNALSKLRTGMESPEMLDHIIIEIGGVKMPLNRIADVSVLDQQTLGVYPYVPNALKELEKAISLSPYGLNPKTENKRLIAAISLVTKMREQAVWRVVANSAEA